MSTSIATSTSELLALTRAVASLVRELEHRVTNLDEGLEPLDAQSKCASDEQAEAYVNSLLAPLRVVRDEPNPDDCESGAPSSPTRAVTTDVKGVPVLLDVHDVARVCGVAEKTVRRWREDGTLPSPIVLGGVIRWTREDLLGLIARRGVVA